MASVKGATKAERDKVRAENRRANELAHARDLGKQARTGHDKVKAAGLAALAASKRMTDDASRRLALAIAQAVDAFDGPENWRTGR